MASDFSVAWHGKRTIGFSVMDQTQRPYPTRSFGFVVLSLSGQPTQKYFVFVEFHVAE
jgi:hypothetical protein